MKSIAVLITVFNRKEKTLNCIANIGRLRGIENFNLEIFIVDGGSKDGTVEAVRQYNPQVHIKVCPGLFWAGGMRQAWSDAIAYNPGFDYFLLLNDDTNILPSCLESLLHAEEVRPNGIYVGSTRDSQSGKLTYGGIDFDGKWIVPDGKNYRECYQGNANIMMVTKSAYQKLGGLCTYYTHGIADYDYTMRAAREGVPCLVPPDYCGECENDHKATWAKPSDSLSKRIQYLYSPKGLAFKEYTIFMKQFYPRSYVLKTQCKMWIKTLFPILWEKFKNTDLE